MGLGLSPVYRFFNPATGAHIFTLDHGERDGLLQPGSGFAYEGVGFSAYASGGGDRDPVFRLFDPTTGIHIFTADPADRDAALAAGAFDEGVAFYGA